MLRQTVFFNGIDASENNGLWLSNGTTAGTYELNLPDEANVGGIFPTAMVVFNGEVLFDGVDPLGNEDLFATNGTAAGTQPVLVDGISPYDLTAYNNKVLFAANATSDLWVTDGTAAGTQELTGINDPNGTYSGGIFYGVNPDLTVFNGEVYFDGRDTVGSALWRTDGTAGGTSEIVRFIGVSGRLGVQDMTVFSGHLWLDVGASDLQEGDGTNFSSVNAFSGAIGGIFSGINDPDMTADLSQLFFVGQNASNQIGLWVIDGSESTAHEVTGINGAWSGGIFSGVFPDFTVFNDVTYFAGRNASNQVGLWFTDPFDTSNTHELTGISGAYSGGIFGDLTAADMAVLNGVLLFEGRDQNGLVGLWVSDGTSEGTHELTGIAGAFPSGLTPTDLTAATLIIPPPDDFTNNNTSDILFRDSTSGDTWVEAITGGAVARWDQIGGSDTTYSAAGVGDFYGTGTDDILFRDNSTGDTWFEAISNGAFAGWNQIGGSNTSFGVAGIGDFYGSNGISDILFRNSSTGDTWFEAINNGVAGWHQIGGSDTHYSVVGVGDFFESGVDDILFRNNSTGDTWIEAITNGASAGWDQIGGSDTHYYVAGVGDFFGNGSNDILFRNNSTGDTWFEAISNGAFAGWHQIGGSDTTYAVVGVGDYFGNNTSDILFRNSAGDTWVEQITNGAFASWSHIGGSNTSYSVPVTVGPPALT